MIEIKTNGILWFGGQLFSNLSLLLAEPNMADGYIAYVPKAGNDTEYTLGFSVCVTIYKISDLSRLDGGHSWGFMITSA